MATKKKQPKKAAAKKAAPRKTTVKTTATTTARTTPRAAPRVRNTVASRSTNRSANRVATSYTLPPGVDLKKYLEKLLSDIKKAGGDKQRVFQYAVKDLKVDLGEMLERPEEDAKAFALERTPVTAQHLELLGLFQDEITKLGTDEILTGASTEVVTEDMLQAMQAVVTKRKRVADRGVACNIPAQTFDLRRSAGSPTALFGRSMEILGALNVCVNQFDDVSRAVELRDEFKAAVDTLGGMLGERGSNTVSRKDTDQRRRLLYGALYLYMQWLSRWGRVVFADDRDGLRRWRMDKTFPKQDQLEEPSLEETITKTLTGTPTPA